MRHPGGNNHDAESILKIITPELQSFSSGRCRASPAAQTLAGINPDVALESFTMNITTLEGFDAFKASLEAPGSGGAASRVDLVLSCVDNYEARMTINQVRACVRVVGAGARVTSVGGRLGAQLRGVLAHVLKLAGRCLGSGRRPGQPFALPTCLLQAAWVLCSTVRTRSGCEAHPLSSPGPVTQDSPERTPFWQ